LQLHIGVDGGINEKTVKTARDYGANMIVAGTTIFKAQNALAVRREMF